MTDSYLTLTTFVPGTKAKADEVNANFSALKDALVGKATMSGDSTKTFSVADATADKHAVNKSQIEALSEDLTAEIAKTGTKFCVKSGNTTNGIGDLFSYDVLRITPKIAGTYRNLVFSDYKGEQSIISTTPANISMTGKPDGDYNIFIKTDGTLYTLDNTIYRQCARPIMLDGDIWLNTSIEPFSCVKYDGTSDVEFLDVPLGVVTVKNAAITALETLAFNQNGNDVTTQTALGHKSNLSASIPNLVMPDYTNPVTKSFATVYQATTDGYLYMSARFSGAFYVSAGNPDVDTSYTWTTILINNFGDQGFTSTLFLPIPKNMYYKVTTTNATGQTLKFFPCLAS